MVHTGEFHEGGSVIDRVGRSLAAARWAITWVGLCWSAL